MISAWGKTIPNWPEFKLERRDGWWWAYTHTGRPVTPVFGCPIAVVSFLSEAEAKQAARHRLDSIYATAHPEGCPSRAA